MPNAFGVEHEPIEKLSMKPINSAAKNFKTGWKNPNIKMTPGGAAAATGQEGIKGVQLKAAQAGSHLQRNKKAYGVGTGAGAGGAAVGYGASNQKKYNRY